MPGMKSRLLPWAPPQNYAAAIDRKFDDMAFLFSSQDFGYSEHRSIIGCLKVEEIQTHNWNSFEQAIKPEEAPFNQFWMGYLGYGLKNDLESLPVDSPTYIEMPDLWMTRYAILLVFDHKSETCTAYYQDDESFDQIPIPIEGNLSVINDTIAKSIDSNMTKDVYLEKVSRVLEAIHRGDLYQANLTRKFHGILRKRPETFSVFLDLCKKSPSPYSCYLKMGKTRILSSSPEQFLKMTADRDVEARPIKGSAPRFKNKKQDDASRQFLSASAKDQSENLMIVDLMRNDLSRGSETGSVSTQDMFKITSFETVHHMSSTIKAKRKAEVSALTLIKGAFPPGSMTGTPKIKAMTVCSNLEKQRRGVYSGALGWISGDGSADLSVVIRTLLIREDKFEFQAGGAIVADSTPEGEWEETLVKCRAVAAVLGLNAQSDLSF
ncbi:MAG: para-aminobenzoate synthetase component 1 [Candidatus Marinamargulisbacteria bacterium]|jgi:para-aminobenzoate synthetase component 1